MLLNQTKNHAYFKEEKLGKIVAFKGTKGGVGTTTLAVEFCALAVSLGYKTAAIDLDYICGDLPVRLNIEPAKMIFNLADLADLEDELDPRIFYKTAAINSEGIMVFGLHDGQVPISRLSQHKAARVFESAIKAFDYTVVDLPPTADDFPSSLANLSGCTILITTPEVSSILRARQFLEAQSAKGMRNTLILINRSLRKRDSITTSEIERYIGLSPIGVISEKTFHFRLAANTGEYLINDTGKISREIRGALGKIFQFFLSAR